MGRGATARIAAVRARATAACTGGLETWAPPGLEDTDLEITPPLRTNKRFEPEGAAGTTRAFSWRPILGERLSKFVGHHRRIWDVVMALLTIAYVVLGFFQDARRGSAADTVVWVLSGLFLLEFLLRCLDDASPRRYLRDHWIDLVTCFPAVGPLRLLRLIRLLRVFNSAGFIKRLAADKGDESSTAGLRLLGATVFVFWLLAGYAFYVTELNQPRTMVHSFADALFLAFTTSTTVGYSPMKAVSFEGQFVAGLVIFVGLGLLAVASSRLTSLWMGDSAQQGRDDMLRDIRDQLRSSESRLAAIEASVGIHMAQVPPITAPVTVEPIDLIPAVALPSMALPGGRKGSGSGR